MKPSIASILLVITSGCIADVAPEDLPTDADMPPIMSEAAMANNEQTAFNYFVNKGLTKVQAAGIVGNLIQESGVDPTIAQYGGGPGRGIAQWSVGGRWNSGTDSVATYAANHGTNRWALTTQLDFIWWELNNYSSYGLASLKSATTISSATYAFMAKYEICGACAQSARIADAQRVLNEYGGSGGGGGGGGGGGVQCYSGTLGKDMPDNACVQSKYDSDWYQCSNGAWVDRWSDPDACNGVYPL